MKKHLGVFIAESPAPLAFPTNILDTSQNHSIMQTPVLLSDILTPRDYYLDSMTKVADTQ